jgi:DNA-binding beta-propeller fold protein YncE
MRRRHLQLAAVVGLAVVLTSSSAGSVVSGERPTIPVAYVVDWGGHNSCFMDNCTFIAWGTLAGIDTGNDHRLRLTRRPHFGNGPPFSITLASDGVKAYVVAGTEVTPVDLRTDRAYRSIHFGNTLTPINAAVAPDDRTLYILTANARNRGVVEPVNAVTGAVGRGFAVGADPQWLAISPLSSWGLVVHAHDVAVFSLATDRVVATIDVGGTPGQVAFAPNGLMAYVVDRANVVPIDMSTLTKEAAIHVGGVVVHIGIGGIAIAPDSATAYVFNSETGVVTCIDLLTSVLEHRISLGSDAGPDAIAITPDGRQAFVVEGAQGAVRAINLSNYRVTAKVSMTGAADGIVIAP